MSFRMSGKGKKARMEFKRKETAKIGVYMLILTAVGLLIASFFINYEENVAKTYVLSKGFELLNPASFDKVLKENKYVAVMFKSETCPVCKRMYPYWLRFAASSGKVKVYVVTYSPSTAPLFQRFGIEDVPTFMVFKNGKLVAKHIGGFVGNNVTEVMREWVYGSLGLFSNGPDYWFSVYVTSCSRCHGAPRDLNATSIRAWLSSPEAKDIAKLVDAAVNRGVILSKYLGSFKALEDKVAKMKMYTQLTEDQIKNSAKFLDYVSAVLLGKQRELVKELAPKTQMVFKEGAMSKVSSGSNAYTGVLAFIVGLAAGISAAFSPCVFPLFITHVTSSIRKKKVTIGSSVLCAVLAAAGVTLLGLLFLVFSDAVLAIQKMILPVVGAAVLLAGLASLLDIPMDIGSANVGKKSDHAFCALYGFLSVQCNLPLVIGALLLIATAGGLSTLVGFALGIGIPLAIVSYLAPKAKNLAMAITKRSKEIEIISSALMVIAGVYLLLYSFGVV